MSTIVVVLLSIVLPAVAGVLIAIKAKAVMTGAVQLWLGAIAVISGIIIYLVTPYTLKELLIDPISTGIVFFKIMTAIIAFCAGMLIAGSIRASSQGNTQIHFTP